jgi:hypothetical protein
MDGSLAAPVLKSDLPAGRQKEKSSSVASNDPLIAKGPTLNILEHPINTSEAISEKKRITISLRNNLDVVFEKNDVSRIDPDGGIKIADEVSVCCGPSSSSDTSKVIVSMLEKYRMAPRDHSQQEWLAKGKFLNLVQHHIERGQVIPMVLPAFPFKSPNKTFKVLGSLPDKGEEVALAHLDGLCRAIEDVYKKGARVDIVSDGLMYNGKNIQTLYTLKSAKSGVRPIGNQRQGGVGIRTGPPKTWHREGLWSYQFCSPCAPAW